MRWVMTGYLHLRDDAKLAAAVQRAIPDFPCTLGHEAERCPTVYAVLRALRGLSVEPTEGAAQRVRQWCEFHRANYNGAPAERLSSSYRDAPLLLADLESLVAAPVPVQEDRPTCEHGRTAEHWYPNPVCEERWPECISCGYDPRCCRWPKSCSADERCAGPAAESSGSAVVVQEDRP